jgi:glutathione S-transferase
LTAQRTLYDLAGADPLRRFSPYCWRTKLALAHKGLSVETVPWRFTEKDVIAFSGSKLVPVLVDGERTVHDSWAIANYLEDAYPDAPSLFGGDGGRAATRFVNAWVDGALGMPMIRVILADIYAHVHEKDRDYFRDSRHRRYGGTIEEVTSDPEAKLLAFRQTLDPVRLALRTQPYLGGQAPLYADYILLGNFLWARCVSKVGLIAEDDPLHAWRERMLDALDGMGRKAYGGYPV